MTTVRTKDVSPASYVQSWLKDANGLIVYDHQTDKDSYLTIGAKHGTDYNSFNAYYF